VNEFDGLSTDGKVQDDGIVRNILLAERKVDHRLLALEVTFKVHSCSYLPVFVLPQDVTEHGIAAETEKVIEILVLKT
jgi:hypothetical protein